MKLIKNKNAKYLLVGIIITLIFFVSVIDTRGQEKAIDPITYDFYNDSIFDIDQENNPTYYNIKDQTEYNGNYESIYSFENDQVGNFPNDFELYLLGSECSAHIVDEVNGHNKVFNLSDNSDTDKVIVNQYFDKKQYNENISFWWSSNVSNVDFHTYLWITIRDDNNIAGMRLGFNYYSGHQIGYFDNDYIFTNLYNDVVNNTWYHIFLAFNYIDFTFDFYVNHELIDSDLEFIFNITSMTYIQFETRDVSTQGGFTHSIDGLDYSWSNDYYNLRNFIPIQENTRYLEVDKYEFDYSNSAFESNNMIWKQSEKDESSNDIYIHSDNDISNYISIYTFYGALYSHGFQYENISSNAMVLNISINMEILSEVENKDYIHDIYLNVKNQSSSTVKLKINMNDGYLSIYNPSIDSYENKFIVSGSHEYCINIYINCYDNILMYWIKDLYNSLTYSYIYNFDVDIEYLYGLDDIFITTTCFETVGLSALEIGYYSIGIYEYGKSFINFNNDYEFGLMSYQMYEQWNSDCHNLLTIDSINDYKLYVNLYYNYFLDGYIIRERNNQSQLEITNLQDRYDNNYPKFIYNCPYLIFQLYGNFTNFYEIEIEGIKLIDNNGLSVYGNYYYNNSNPNDNWFYVIDNKLFYHFNNSENPYTETMRISFNVNDILLDNESLISYSSYITNNYSGYIYVSSYHNTEIFNISESETIENTYLNMTDTEHFTLKEILIEIKTNDDSSGLVDGYIQNINVYPEKPLFPDFKPIEYLDSTFIEKMIETIIPIMFFIVPSLLMKTRYGNKAVIPIWLLITFVLLIANFIPFWICFIIFLGIGLMMLNKDEVLE